MEEAQGAGAASMPDRPPPDRPPPRPQLATDPLTSACVDPSTTPALPYAQTIHELVMELGYEDTRTEIHTIDSQVRGLSP